MSIKLGMDAKLYFCAAGIGGTPSWTEITNVRDLTLSLASAEADVTTRGNGGWRATAPTLKEASIEWEMIWDSGDTGFEAIRDAWLNKTAPGLAVMDGDITTAGSQGLWADCAITQFNREEPLEEGIKVSVVAKPTYSVNAPLWKEVAGGGGKAAGTISLGGLPSDGDTIVLSDGLHSPITFEFDDDAETTGGNVPVTIGVSADATMAALITAINGAVPLGVTATASTPPDEACTLANDVAGAAGNVAIIKDGANITVTGMSGGTG